MDQISIFMWNALTLERPEGEGQMEPPIGFSDLKFGAF